MDIIGRTDALLKNWSVQKTLEDMEKGGIATSMTSPTTPQVTPLGKDVAVRIAREFNEFAMKMMTDHPGRFGILATLPLPHIDESLKEIAYAFDTLKVDGVGCMTSYGDKWLGHPMFAPVWQELNRRKATVYTHPTGANCCVNLVQGLPDFVVEFGADTTRTIASLIFSGTSQKYQGHQLDLVARRRRADGICRALPDPDGDHAALPRQVHAATRAWRIEALLLRHRAIPTRLTIVALATRAGLADRLRHRFSVSHRRRAHRGRRPRFFKGDDLEAVDRGNAERIVPRLKA